MLEGKLIKLENVFTHKSSSPLVIVDCRVQIFSIISRLTQWQDNPNNQAYKEDSDYFKKLVDELAYCYWVKILNDPLPWLPAPKSGYTVIVVDDCKYSNGTYWRSKYVSNYKGNREPKGRSDLYYRIYSQFNKYISNPKCTIPVFRSEGFEADDFAGAIASIDISSDKFFLTKDSDWKQLVSDSNSNLFANAASTDFRLLSEYEVLREYLDLGYALKSPSEIALVKSIYGDRSDNLDPGSPIGVIDLYNPTEKAPLDVDLLMDTVNKGCNTQDRLVKMSTTTLVQYDV